MEYEEFVATARGVAKDTNTIEITVPRNVAKFIGLEPQDEVRIMIKKIVKPINE